MMSELIDLKNATITDVFLHLLEVQGHSGIDPSVEDGHGSIHPFVMCMVGWPSRHRSTTIPRDQCPACIAVRSYLLYKMTEEDIIHRYNEYHPGHEILLEWWREREKTG